MVRNLSPQYGSSVARLSMRLSRQAENVKIIHMKWRNGGIRRRSSEASSGGLGGYPVRTGRLIDLSLVNSDLNEPLSSPHLIDAAFVLL
jgi:hypothetical protein